MYTCLKRFFPIILLSLFLLGCSQSSPEIFDVTSTLVLEYNDEESLPKTRLSVFAESSTNINRYERVKLYCLQNKYVWDTSDLILIKNSDTEYLGYNNFVLPDGTNFLNGMYEIQVINADQKDYKLTFNLQIDPTLYNCTAEQIVNRFKTMNSIKQIIIYDKDKKIIYYGENKDFNTTRDIWAKYSNAAFYNDVWVTPNNSVMCILPGKNVEPN